MAEAGWKPDPNGRHEWRYFDGVSWTDKVSDGGRTSSDPYDKDAVPPPPSAPPSHSGGSTRPKRVAYRLVILDRKGNEIHVAPYESADRAIRFAEENPVLKGKRSIGSVLLYGAGTPNTVRWQTALILEVDQDTGDVREYHRLENNGSRLANFMDRI